MAQALETRPFLTGDTLRWLMPYFVYGVDVEPSRQRGPVILAKPGAYLERVDARQRAGRHGSGRPEPLTKTEQPELSLLSQARWFPSKIDPLAGRFGQLLLRFSISPSTCTSPSATRCWLPPDPPGPRP